ncbi:hypothetical protein PENSPDRAFT_144024 [Peniophora sp. CONT]|nr:hypothetical protein PENSPDRAFT_144024 [Peniophora sp. CONT]
METQAPYDARSCLPSFRSFSTLPRLPHFCLLLPAQLSPAILFGVLRLLVLHPLICLLLILSVDAFQGHVCWILEDKTEVSQSLLALIVKLRAVRCVEIDKTSKTT